MNREALTDLVTTAIGNGVMIALEGQDGLRRKLLACGPSGTLADALREDAEEFIRIRADLVEAIEAGES